MKSIHFSIYFSQSVELQNSYQLLFRLDLYIVSAGLFVAFDLHCPSVPRHWELLRTSEEELEPPIVIISRGCPGIQDFSSFQVNRSLLSFLYMLMIMCPITDDLMEVDPSSTPPDSTMEVEVADMTDSVAGYSPFRYTQV